MKFKVCALIFFMLSLIFGFIFKETIDLSSLITGGFLGIGVMYYLMSIQHFKKEDTHVHQ